jgi:hypothetical protein
MRDTVFVSYSHKDKKWLEEFMAHLKVFEREMQMNVWVDTQIRAGARWLDDIEAALSSARVAVLLVTADYLASDFVSSREIPPILQAQQEGGLAIAWVAVSATAYAATSLAAFQAVNDPGRPLDNMPRARRQKEWAEIARKVHDLSGKGATAVAATAGVVTAPPSPASSKGDWLSETQEVSRKLWGGIRGESPWTAFICKANQYGVGTIVQIDPEPLRALVARPESAVEYLPVVDKGSLIRLSLNVPRAATGRTLWSGWHVTLLSEDPRGFLCVLPRFLGTPEFPSLKYTRLPRNAQFNCSGLRMDNNITGDHSFVLLANKEPLPPLITSLLLMEHEGETLLPALDLLASYLAPLCLNPRTGLCDDGSQATAGVLRLRFRVR